MRIEITDKHHWHERADVALTHIHRKRAAFRLSVEQRSWWRRFLYGTEIHYEYAWREIDDVRNIRSACKIPNLGSVFVEHDELHSLLKIEKEMKRERSTHL